MSDKIQRIDKDDLFNFLEEVGFDPKSNNNNIHIQIRQGRFSVDIWPTTIRMNVTFDGKKRSYNTVYTIMRELFQLSFILEFETKELEELQNDL